MIKIHIITVALFLALCSGAYALLQYAKKDFEHERPKIQLEIVGSALRLSMDPKK